MDFLYLIALALAPVVFLFSYVYWRDKYEREPLQFLIGSFILGGLAAFPVLFTTDYLQSILGVSHSAESTAFELLIYAFVVVAMLEEGFKYLALRYYMYPNPEFDEPYDGIMYGVAVSLGFAALENIIYVVDGGVETGILRMFTAVPAHATFGAMMGYFVGKAKFMKNPRAAWRERMKGLGVAILFHGLYDYFLFLGEGPLLVFTLLTLLIGIWLARKAMHLHVEDSPHKTPPPEDQTS